MKYALSIDWLALFCQSETGEINRYHERWEYKVAAHGTRQFKQLITVLQDGEEFLEVQQEPCSHIIKPRTLIVRVCNRFLYSGGLWYCLEKFITMNHLRVLNISRIDICADFNVFANRLEPLVLIKRFLDGTFRHIGRGKGSAHFDHYAKREGNVSKSYVNYTGLSFGSHKSECRAYLYNKSFELMTVKDKPHIRKLWNDVGLQNTRECPVWRLEVSIKSGATKFKDKATGDKVEISSSMVKSNDFLSMVYFSFVNALFSFIRNRDGITNISREKRIELFNGEPAYSRRVLDSKSGGNVTERILIKQLWQLCDKYRCSELVADEGLMKQLAYDLAEGCGLSSWLAEKRQEWEKPNKQ